MADVLSHSGNSRPASHQSYGRRAFLPSGVENGEKPRRIRGREVHSRYMSSYSSFSSASTTSSSSSSANSTDTRLSESPLVVRKPVENPSFLRRSQSVERSRPGACDAIACKNLLISARSLSVSFQGEAFPLPVSKVKPSTPERKKHSPLRDLRNVSSNSKLLDQHRWPAKSRPADIISSTTGITDERRRLTPTLFSLQSSTICGTPKLVDSDRKVDKVPIREVAKHLNFQLVKAPTKLDVPKKLLNYNPSSLLAKRGLSSPLRGSAHLPSFPSRGVSSPYRTRRNAHESNVSTTLICSHTVLNHVIDNPKGKGGERNISDAIMLRVLYNRHLQWRYINARADAAFSAQRERIEKCLYAASVHLSKRRDSVREKRAKLRILKQQKKLNSILRKQLPYLEEWCIMERDCRVSLSSTAEALKAATTVVPVCGGARGMSPSLHSLLHKAEYVGPTAAEVAKVVKEECMLLHQCKVLLSTIEALLVQCCSLRTHLLRMSRVMTP